jgi:hypothetical protein
VNEKMKIIKNNKKRTILKCREEKKNCMRMINDGASGDISRGYSRAKKKKKVKCFSFFVRDFFLLLMV